MNNTYKTRAAVFFLLLLLTGFLQSCSKKNDAAATPAVVVQPIAVLGLYQLAVTTSTNNTSITNKRAYIYIGQVGSQVVSYFPAFDTASMITSTGITFTGDSVNVDGITITSKQSVMAYGDAISSTKVYGYLAYAPITIGTNGASITTKRIPFFLYYKILDGNGNAQGQHTADVFGVGPGFSYASNLIASPISYFNIPTGGTNGFKLAELQATNFSSTGPYVSSLLTIGLSPTDLSGSGFIMHPLSTGSTGYSANIPGTVTYNGNTISATFLFDTGTPSVTEIEDRSATSTVGSLPANTVVTITTTKGFSYTYTTSNTGNLTAVQNPNNTGDTRTIFAIDFFENNEYLTDYTNHQIGLKNN